jgi:hypothetical protein
VSRHWRTNYSRHWILPTRFAASVPFWRQLRNCDANQRHAHRVQRPSS